MREKQENRKSEEMSFCLQLPCYGHCFTCWQTPPRADRVQTDGQVTVISGRQQVHREENSDSTPPHSEDGAQQGWLKLGWV